MSDFATPSVRPLSRRDWLRGTVSVAGGLWLFGPGRELTSGNFARGEESFPHKKLIVRQAQPWNAEPDAASLVQSRITPVERFFVRSHGLVPQLAGKKLELKVEGLVHEPLTIALPDLEKFPQADIEATLTCAGNRRGEFAAVKAVGGVQWTIGAIGNAVWSGAILGEVLRKAGPKPEAKHVWFESLDRIEEGGATFPFGGSIPLDKALAAGAQDEPVLLATKMNSEPLRPEHGAPLRSLVPGYIGARSVKWLGRIVVSDRPSPNHYMQDVYKVVTDQKQVPQTDPILEYPLNSAICVPADGANVRRGRVQVAGWSLPTGKPGNTIAKVELSTDGGKTWRAANLRGASRPFCWRLWDADLDLSGDAASVLVRATDSAGSVQPETMAWNMKGYMYNSWHRVGVKLGG